ncbi:MAG: 3-alpha-hydroxysteroid dehydrogenase [Zetaproteobacteria bacterium]|nr:3-alpha-hydroxysteroid dehydrogenase [Pseudobdellovibrionaceae bacterium]
MTTIVMTGGSSGVGAVLLSRLLDMGHEVWNLDIRPGDSSTDKATFVHCDLGDQGSIDGILPRLPEKIDALLNVAGIAQARTPEQLIGVNFLGLRHLTDAILEKMPPGGRIVSVSSVAGRTWQARYENILPLLETVTMDEGISWCANNHKIIGKDPYTFSKRCLTAYTMRMAKQTMEKGVVINCVSPGPIDTPLYPEFEAYMGKDQSDWFISQTGRMAEPSDIAQVIEFLAIGHCKWLNGVDIPVDGGYSAGVDSGWIDVGTSPLMQQIKAKKAVQHSPTSH